MGAAVPIPLRFVERTDPVERDAFLAITQDYQRDHFIRRFREKRGKAIHGISAEALAVIESGANAAIVIGAGQDSARFLEALGQQDASGLVRVVVNDAIRELIQSRANASQIRACARREGMSLLRGDGWEKALAGLTTVEEVLRVTT